MPSDFQHPLTNRADDLVNILVEAAPPLTVDQVDRIRAAFTEAAAIRAGKPHPVDARSTAARRRAA